MPAQGGVDGASEGGVEGHGGDGDEDGGDEDDGPHEIVAGVAGRQRRRNFGINTYLGADEEVFFTLRKVIKM